MTRAGRSITLALLMASLPGCAEEWGAETSPTTKVRGEVRVAGRPISSGWVEFVPIEGTRGDLRSAPIGKGGAFEADGVPVGRVALRLADVYEPAIPTSSGPVGLDVFRSYQTPIRRVIAAGPGASIEIELVGEAEAYRRRQAEQSRMMSEPEG